MTSRIFKAAFVAAVLFVAPAALADSSHRIQPPPRRHFVPEFDPAAAGAMVALLTGGALFIASRRSKSK